MNTITRRLFVLFLLALPVVVSAQNQNEEPLPGWNLKTNLLYDITTTFNLGVEFRTGGHTSVDIPFNYNPWEFKNERKAKHFLVQPEFRWWPFSQTFDGHFFGLHGHYGIYNAENWPHGPFSQYMKDHQFQGWLAGAGVSYGYRWNFNYRWALEATLGVGYAYMDFDRYKCGTCGAPDGRHKDNYFGPTKVGVNLILGLGRKPEPAPVVEEPVIIVYHPTLAPSFVVPETEAVKVRSESGKAYLEFELDRSEIRTGFRDNAAELQKIEQTVEYVKANPDATINGITITGWASPEGTWASNQRLSEARAKSLADYIGNLFDKPLDEVNFTGGGEDWAGLTAMVEGSDMAAETKKIILAAIRDTEDPDVRERHIISTVGVSTYRHMVDNFYPALRRSDYSVDYTVVPFTIEKGKEVIKTHPGDLSLNELFLIANTYEPGSDEFNEVFETAAREFPDSDVANLNAAASALGRRDTTSAADYLGKVVERSDAWWNNNGMLLWLQGDAKASAESLSKAGAEGSANAAEMDKHLRSLTGN